MATYTGYSFFVDTVYSAFQSTLNSVVVSYRIRRLSAANWLDWEHVRKPEEQTAEIYRVEHPDSLKVTRGHIVR